MSDLPKTVGSWGDVVAWLNHHTDLINGLNRRIENAERIQSGHTWDVGELRSRLDLLVFRWVEGELLGELLEQGDPDDGFSLPWSQLEPYLHEEARTWGLYVINARELAEDLLYDEKKGAGAIFTERRGGGFRALTDAEPKEEADD